MSEKYLDIFPDMDGILFGEGYGARIQKGGENYIKDGVDFILFDALVDGWWLERKNIEDIASKFDIKCVPIIGLGTLLKAIEQTRQGIKSTFGDFFAEGLILKPKVALERRNGDRIITKMKTKDFAIKD